MEEYLRRCKVGEIISTFEKEEEFYLKAKIFSIIHRLKLITVDCSFAERHHAELYANPFFNGLNVVTTSRKIIGARNRSDSALVTIRGDFAYEIGRNVIHGSDSVESGRKEIALWFPEGPVSWESSLHPWIYE
ncbi:hypothetical protein I3842_05G158200 [Carya illinoinensis]|uniref:Nucleoside diphosphate kinase n=1 Tax=Carya illinoinensis TaxID=32201 RepID=A0A922EZZ7_CARIL|nr:hypothetical protein I3842_05G158200 [Carya illinoinensis]